MSTPMNAQCYLCHFNKNVEKARHLGSEADATAFSRELMKMYLSAPEGVSAPWFEPATYALLDQYFHIGLDPYKAEKEAKKQGRDDVLANIEATKGAFNSAAGFVNNAEEKIKNRGE